MVGWSGLYHGMVRVKWWDCQLDMVGCPSCKHWVARVIWWGWPGFNMHSSMIVWYDEDLKIGMAMLKSWGGQGYIVGWPGCNMTCPGFNMNMVRMQHGVARFKNNALYRTWPWGSHMAFHTKGLIFVYQQTHQRVKEK